MAPFFFINYYQMRQSVTKNQLKLKILFFDLNQVLKTIIIHPLLNGLTFHINKKTLSICFC